MPVEGRGLGSRPTQDVVRTWRLGNLSTPISVQKLQMALHAKAKSEADYRFYALYDKIYREDILAHAYAQCRSNKGAPGVDGQEFADVETYGVERWLLVSDAELDGRIEVFIAFFQGLNLRALHNPSLNEAAVVAAARLALAPLLFGV